MPYSGVRVISTLGIGPETRYQVTPQTTGLIVPLYTYPTSPTWQALIQERIKNPGVQIIAIINPYNGPIIPGGPNPDPNYVVGINSLRAAGIIVVGYVFTHYAQSSAASVESNIYSYSKMYNVSGIFFDEVSNAQVNVPYYSSLVAYTSTLGMKITVGNPGTSAPSDYSVFDVLVIYENQGQPLISTLAPYSQSREKFAFISFSVSPLNETYVSQSSKYCAWLYITNASLPNPYDVFPPYLSSEVASLPEMPVVSILPLK